MTENRSVVTWDGAGRGGKDEVQRSMSTGGTGYTYYFDCGDGFTGVYILIKTDKISHLKNVQFILCQL